MKAKKIMALIMAAAMAVPMAACGGAKEAETAASGKTDNETKAPVEDEDTKKAEETKENKEDKKDVKVPEFEKTATIEETVMVDEDNVKITATSLEYSGYSADLNITIENNSDKNLKFISGSLGYSCNEINGYMFSGGYLNEEVEAGKKCNASISFSTDELLAYGITELADIKVGIQISDDDYNRTYSGPRQVKTSAADGYDYSKDTYFEGVENGTLAALGQATVDYYSDAELYSQNGVRIISEALLTNSDGDKSLFVEVVNDSESSVEGVIGNLVVNDIMVSYGSYTVGTINPGAKSVLSVDLSSTMDEACFELLKISDLGKISFKFSQKDDMYNDIAAPGVIEVAVSDKTVSPDTTGEEVYNEGGIKIISKGAVKDAYESSDDVHLVFLVENGTSTDIDISDSWDSFSVNGYMIDYSASGTCAYAGKWAVIDVQIWGSTLEENNISGVDDITSAEITFELEDADGNDIAEPKVSVNY